MAFNRFEWGMQGQFWPLISFYSIFRCPSGGIAYAQPMIFSCRGAVVFHFLGLIRTAVLLIVFAGSWPLTAMAADREKIEAFLEVTGFDAALVSIALSAKDAPQMLGIDPGTFGSEWERLSNEVFDTAIMRGFALELLEKTLGDEPLSHAAGFYATDLGQRLVAEENRSHMDEDENKQAEGRRIVSALVEEGSPRLELLKRMNRAIDVAGTSLKSLQEVQFRFLMAASAAGVIELKMDADELRALLSRNDALLRIELEQSALAGAAYTYRGFSDEDLSEYAQALEDPVMQDVYLLLNAVQFEIMANRFEALAHRMSDLQRGQDI
ncbi:DUF2059 domain-containing protein [Seohaeicola saemankumensis]|nr:DUF2059 domain-containing protein [Seohaeicola saemankumensis]MCA0873332.1 DUF2059 domain-containing protein [Seohaeicola saemankumensis]